VHVFAVARRQ